MPSGHISLNVVNRSVFFDFFHYTISATYYGGRPHIFEAVLTIAETANESGTSTVRTLSLQKIGIPLFFCYVRRNFQ